MSVAYNEYVLSTAYHSGWINEEQYHATVAALETMPGVPALNHLFEQGMLTQEQTHALTQAINDDLAAAESATRAQIVEPDPHSSSEYHGQDHQAHPGEKPLHVNMLHDSPHDFPQGHTIDSLLSMGLSAGASDIHISIDAPPLMRRHGQLVPIFDGAEPITAAHAETLSKSFINDIQYRILQEKRGLEFSHMVEGVGRFRASVIYQRKGFALCFRVVNTKIRTMDELNLPPILRTLTEYHNGLVLVTGAVGTGKSTTMAAMVEEVNRKRRDHIITLEDPIEFVYQPAGCQVTQREVHNHTESFAVALRASLREDPDVIVVGEMRDIETISLAVTASETGHLVIGTLHTSSAARTLDRLLDAFPIEQQGQIRTMVSESLRGIISQQLIPRMDGNGRAMAMEIMINTPAVANIIRDGRTFMLPGIIQTGRKLGMRLMDDSLMELVENKIIHPQDAFDRADQKKLFERFL